MSYTKPNTCLICGTIVTFCGCERSIFDKDEYIEWARERIKKLERGLKFYASDSNWIWVQVGDVYHASEVEIDKGERAKQTFI